MLPEQRMQIAGGLPDTRASVPFKKVVPYEESVLPFRLKDAMPLMSRGAARLREHGTRFIVAETHGNYPANLVNAVVHAGKTLAESANVPQGYSPLDIIPNLHPFTNISVDELQARLLNPDPFTFDDGFHLTSPRRIGLIVLDYQDPEIPNGSTDYGRIALGALDFVDEEVFVYPVPGLSTQAEIEA